MCTPVTVKTNKKELSWTPTGAPNYFFQVNIDDCLGVDCHSGFCVDLINAYICNCTAAVGEHCETGDAHSTKERQ